MKSIVLDNLLHFLRDLTNSLKRSQHLKRKYTARFLKITRPWRCISFEVLLTVVPFGGSTGTWYLCLVLLRNLNNNNHGEEWDFS